ncbi:alpha-(1,3)-fucosyltransferase fut-6-like [Mya arenaria]|uniref:alpha-(1,3)-fucosyltransferase fut-6-like n=1 Tax=Mya arenaria TaxID=6604 RepID=UPI0022E955DE|nr:alpha-(1,3)-fucosyltransferase fut-6-like [Mya arenaria]
MDIKVGTKLCFVVIAIFIVMMIVLSEEIPFYLTYKKVDLNRALLCTGKRDLGQSVPEKSKILGKVTSLFDIPINFYSKHKTNTSFTKIQSTSIPNKIIDILLYKEQPFATERAVNKWLSNCFYNNCKATNKHAQWKNVSAVVYYYHAAFGIDKDPPISRAERDPNQVWVYLNHEPPLKINAQNFKSKTWLNTFNWTMTYRFDSDVFIPYGSLATKYSPQHKDYSAIYNMKTDVAFWMVGDCKAESGRDAFVYELQKHGLKVNTYGSCGQGKLDTNKTQEALQRHKFYLALENTFCKDYVTEKFFDRYNDDLILVVRGGADYDTILPTGTYVNAGNFETIQDLANYLIELGNDKNKYMDMMKRKDTYKSIPDTFGSQYGFCDLCEKLNKVNLYKNSYENIADHLQNDQCWLAKDVSVDIKVNRFVDVHKTFLCS